MAVGTSKTLLPVMVSIIKCPFFQYDKKCACPHPVAPRIISITTTAIEFSYDFGGKRYYVSIGPGNEFGETFIVLAGKIEGILVRCDVSVNSRERMDRFDILVKPYWAHRGASHFLDLVREGYYDGVVFHRMVPNFLTQFGIARDYDARTKARKNAIRDDRALGIKLKPGYLSFAGNGVNSRTTEIFVVNPGVSEADLKELGKNGWERPFGFIVGDVNNSAISNVYSGYGDMFPFGNGKPFSVAVCCSFWRRDIWQF